MFTVTIDTLAATANACWEELTSPRKFPTLEQAKEFALSFDEEPGAIQAAIWQAGQCLNRFDY